MNDKTLEGDEKRWNARALQNVRIGSCALV